MDYTLGKKGVSDLPIFDGDYPKFKYWKDKLTDFAAESNPDWR